MNNNKIVKLFATFQDNDSLYFLLEYIPCGTLSKYIMLKGALKIEDVRFLTSEILRILKYFRENGIIHRDLKPENLLLNEEMNIKIVDFGTAKVIENERNKNLIKSLENNFLYLKKNSKSKNIEKKLEEIWKRNSLAGSPFYIAPEILENMPISFACDYWSLGILVYKLIHNEFPFNNDYNSYINNKFSIDNLKFKDNLDEDCKDFIIKLLEKDPNKRLGMGDSFENLITHPFLKEYKIIKDFNEMKSPLHLKGSIKIIKKDIDLIFDKKKKNKINDTSLISQGNMKIKKLKFFKKERFCKLYSSGRMMFLSADKNNLKNDFFINKKTKVLKKGKDTYELSNSFFNNVVLVLKDKEDKN